MGEAQFYNPIEGFNRMIFDMEGFIEPVVEGMLPVASFFSTMNFYIIAVVFVGVLAYMIFVRQHSFVRKLRTPKNYFAAIIFLGIYLFFLNASMTLGVNSIGQEITFGLDFVVMPMAAKMFGPIVGCIFGMIQYGSAFLVRNETFNVGYMLVAGISAMLYAWVLYQRRTKYLRCVTAKLFVNIVCNIIFVPFYSTYGAELTASALANQLIVQIVFVPIQAVFIYIALILLRKTKRLLSDVAWGFGD